MNERKTDSCATSGHGDNVVREVSVSGVVPFSEELPPPYPRIRIMIVVGHEFIISTLRFSSDLNVFALG